MCAIISLKSRLTAIQTAAVDVVALLSDHIAEHSLGHTAHQHILFEDKW